MGSMRPVPHFPLVISKGTLITFPTYEPSFERDFSTLPHLLNSNYNHPSVFMGTDSSLWGLMPGAAVDTKIC